MGYAAFAPIISEADRLALAERRAALRAIALEMAETLEALPPPETYIEVTRAARAVMVCDQSFARLPSDPEDETPDETADETPDPLRERLRSVADQLLDTMPALPKPASFEDAQRASRALRVMDRLFTQLYSPPKRSSADVREASAADNIPRKETLLEHIERFSFRHAFHCGVWPDGTLIDPDVPDAYNQAQREAESHFVDTDLRTFSTDVGEQSGTRLHARLLIARINAVVRQRAMIDGQWPHGPAYAEGDSDFYDIAVAFEHEAESGLPRPVPEGFTEVRGDPSFPWWMIHRMPDPQPP